MGKYLTLLITIFILLITSISYADVFIVYNPKTNQIYGISNKADIVIPEGYLQEIIKANVNDFPSDMSDYIFKDKKISLNIEKINARKEQEIEARKMADDEQAIQNKIRKMAYEQLKQEGVIFKKYTDADFQK